MPSPPAGRISQLIRLFHEMRKRAGHPEFRARRENLSAVDEGAGGPVYSPLAAADQPNGVVLFNPLSPSAAEPNTEPNRASAKGLRNYQRGTVAHETGHLLEPSLIGGRANADVYQLAALGYLGRPWLTQSVAGRAENARVPQGRSQWGLPTEGPLGIHSAPVEQYANDAGYALGYSFGPGNTRQRGEMNTLGHLNPRQLRKLRGKGLLPR